MWVSSGHSHKEERGSDDDQIAVLGAADMGLTGHHLAKLSDRELIFLAEVWGRAGPPDSLR